MTANETYKILRPILGPWFRSNGFKVAKGYLTYQKRMGSRYLNVRFQCNSHGWEKHKGSSFTVFMEYTDTQDIEYANLRRLTDYLAFEQLEFIRARQNRILESIPQPPADYIQTMISAFEKTFRDPQPYVDAYLKDWKPVTHPYTAADDIWFRYFTEADVRSWAILLGKHVQHIYNQMERSAA